MSLQWKIQQCSIMVLGPLDLRPTIWGFRNVKNQIIVIFSKV